MFRRSLGFLLLLFTTTLPIGLLGQTKPGAIVAGKILDSETDNPLENAIVFLVNTPIGASSANDGTFRIPSIPVGEYQMVIARVGYERDLVNLDIAKPESLYYQIKLKPQPVRTGGVEVYGERPAELKPNPMLFLPKETSDAYCIYGAANTMPIGIFFSDSALYMYSLDTAIIDSEKYIRIWLLYKNVSQIPYDLDPMKCVRLHMKGKTYSYKNLVADQVSEIHEKVKNEDATEMLSSTIGKELHVSAGQDSLIKSIFLGFSLANTIRDSFDPFGTKFELIGEQSNAVGQMSGGALFQIYSMSQNDGILKRHLVYPNNSVHGYVYFPFPGLNWKATTSSFPEATEYVYTIEIITQSGSKFIEFLPY